MLKRFLLSAAIAVMFVFQTFIGSANAVELDVEARTVPLNEQGETIVLTLDQVALGRKRFNSSCASCHLSGGTKTNPNIDLSEEALSGAFPNRNNIAGLVDYMKNPTTYDGFTEISEVHPSLKSADVYPKMRNLSEDDLVAIAGHILTQPKVNPERWASGKDSF
ncbi:MAG: photosystem II cytochrome c-550 [Cyanobacteria bacterium P01_E01_bin.6]